MDPEPGISGASSATPDKAPGRIVIVTGLPRSGTSLCMQMLSAGGVPVHTDGARTADVDNPRGYYEDERVKRLDRDTSWLHEAEGKALKVVAPLLRHLPRDLACDVIFVTREMDEVLRSQAAMMRRRGLPASDAASDAALREAFEFSLAAARRWLQDAPAARCLELAHAEVLAHPRQVAQQMGAFLGRELDVDAMAGVVDIALHRNQSGHSTSP